MQRLEVNSAVRPLLGSLGIKGLMRSTPFTIQNKDKQKNACMNTGSDVFTVI